MQRYFTPEANWKDQQITIMGRDAHHINRVMRLKIGDKIICNHPQGQAAVCEIGQQDADAVIVHIKEWLDDNTELPVDVTIAQGLPKGDKFDFVLQKGTELGAKAFIPVKTDRSVVVWDQKKMQKKIERFQKIVKEAAEQSHRNQVPSVQTMASINQLIEISHAFDVLLFAFEEEAKTEQYQSFAAHVKRLNPGMRLLVCIGPEGGFSRKEAEALRSNGFKPVRLGPRILRTETAALYVLSSISYHLEELECLS